MALAAESTARAAAGSRRYETYREQDREQRQEHPGLRERLVQARAVRSPKDGADQWERERDGEQREKRQQRDVLAEQRDEGDCGVGDRDAADEEVACALASQSHRERLLAGAPVRVGVADVVDEQDR